MRPGVRAHIEIDDGATRRRLSFIARGQGSVRSALLCLHGLTRNARDFDFLAERMAGDRRVIAVDIAGRGQSDPLSDAAGYQIPTYVQDVVALLDALGLDRVDWLGTSMGGLIAMAIAADPRIARRIGRLVLNDVGPLIPAAALARIGQYVGREWRFPDLAAAESHVRAAYAPFGRLSDAQWRFMTEISVVADAGGGYVPAYDPAIGAASRGQDFTDIGLWPLWDAIRAPVLVLRGADSDVLLAETAAEMTRRGPRAELVTFDGVGHAPALFDDDQIEVIARWLNSPK